MTLWSMTEPLMPQQRLGILMAKSRWVILALTVPWLFCFFLIALVPIAALKQHDGSRYSEVLILEYIGDEITSVYDWFWLHSFSLSFLRHGSYISDFFLYYIFLFATLYTSPKLLCSYFFIAYSVYCWFIFMVNAKDVTLLSQCAAL